MKETEKLYNFCVNEYNTGKQFPTTVIQARKYIFSKLYPTKKYPVPYDILVYEIRNFCSNITSCKTNLANGNITHYEIKNKNMSKHQTVTIDYRCVGKKSFYKKYLGEIKNFNKKVKNFEIICKL